MYSRPAAENSNYIGETKETTDHPTKHATHDGNKQAKKTLQIAQTIALQEEECESINSCDKTAFPQRDPAGGHTSCSQSA